MGIRELRDTITQTADKMTATAADTKHAIIGLAVIAGIALAVALLALGIGMKARAA